MLNARAKIEALLVEKAKLGDELERALRSITSQQATISQHEAKHKCASENSVKLAGEMVKLRQELTEGIAVIVHRPTEKVHGRL